MLVQHIADGSIGIVTQVTKKWVHVLWLANKSATDDPDSPDIKDNGTHGDNEGMHHFTQHYPRSVLKAAPKGSNVTIRQVEL